MSVHPELGCVSIGLSIPRGWLARCMCALHQYPTALLHPPAHLPFHPTVQSVCCALRAAQISGRELRAVHSTLPAKQLPITHPTLTPCRPANLLRRSGVARWCPSCSP